MEYLVILEMGNDTFIPVKVSAISTIDAMSKTVEFCNKEGYFAKGMKCIQLLKSVGIVVL
jgi:flavodoxin